MSLGRQGALALTCLLSATWLVGCGLNPAAVRRARPVTNARPPLAAPQNLAPAPLMGARQVPEVAQMQEGLRRVQAQVPGFSATIETFDKGPGGQETNLMKVTFRKPSTLKIEMLRASGQAQGAQIVWTGGDNLKIKPSFLPMAVDKSIHDTQTKSKNGWTIKDTEVNAIFRVLLDPAAQIRPLGMQPVEGRPLSAFEVRSALSPKGASHEVVAIDPQTGMPAARLVYRNAELIYRASIKAMQVKAVGTAEVSL